jgi:hypothetical protein
MLFTNPVTLTDGTTPQTFDFRGQMPSPNSRITEWVDLAASTEASPIFVVKHDIKRPSVPRRAFGFRCGIHPAASTEDTEYVLNTMTFSLVNGSRSIVYTDLEYMYDIFKDALNEANFLRNFMAGMG